MAATFHPIIRDWFEGHFEHPTPAQEQGWPAIESGRNTLIAAPTGSGKTFAAFLVCIDGLLRASLAGDLPEESRVVYVSPLKALSNDVHKNLAVPLQEIAHLAHSRRVPLPEIRIALRTGDTSAYERQTLARRPPHIWITTPESLYLLLTSASGRRSLKSVRTVILDEIHAVAGNKRGSHLALSVERLAALTGAPLQRIGLSATQNPIEEISRFLAGAATRADGGSPACTVIDIGHRRDCDLRVEIPGAELGPIARQELWGETVSRIAALVREHRTTLVFVNTRRLVEKVSHQLSEILGEDAVVAHHGSLARKTRLRAEERLKSGDARVAVATASLELGIDVGSVELVCQVGSPRSIGVLLQRVGRSGHKFGTIPMGRLFPLTRDELVECAALLFAVRRGDLDRLTIPAWPLDILAQQIVAMVAAEDWTVDDLFQMVRCAYPYRQLPRASFDGVIRLLSEGTSPRLGRRAAFLHHDRVHGVLRARRGARIAALTCGGAIPDNADYDVVCDPDGMRLGSVTEDFAVESVAGDVFLLGNSSWRIRRVERGRVRVEDARGLAPSVPFWLGEAPGRTIELSRAISDVRAGVEERMAIGPDCLRWLQETVGLSEGGAGQVLRYMAEGRRVLGTVPTLDRIAVERFFDESGGTQLVLHAPWGSAINRAWGLALRKSFCRTFDFELQAAATDDGLVLSLGAQHSFPIDDFAGFLRSGNVEKTLIQAVLASPLFTTRWRWTLTRSLSLLRFAGGRRVPPAIQRMRAEDLLSAVFPAQTQCQDNRPARDIDVPDHPLVFETLRDCMTEALDAAGLRRVLEKLEKGEIEITARDTPIPSLFSHQILNAMPYAFLDDAPLEERRARAVFLRRVLPDEAGDLGRLDPEAIRTAAADAWPPVRDHEELHDLLCTLIAFPEDQIDVRLPGAARDWLTLLERSGRARRVAWCGRGYWTAVERAVSCCNNREESEPPQPLITDVVRGWMEVSGPVTGAWLVRTLAFEPASIQTALVILEGEGLLLRGHFSTVDGEVEFCDRRILARIHRATVSRLRREIEAVPPSVFLRFLFFWQHVGRGVMLEGEHGLLGVIEQLQGFEAPAAAWENDILPARVRGYQPSMLDSLCLNGEVAWGRWTHRATHAEVPAHRPGLSRTAAIGIGMRSDLGWLLDGSSLAEDSVSAPARSALGFLRTHGASFFPDIVSGCRLLPAQVEDALWQLVAAGEVTADAFEGLRALVTGAARRADRSPRRRRKRGQTRIGRWSLLAGGEASSPDRADFWARQVLRRYGVLMRELLLRESAAPPWREMLPHLRRMEARGEIRGGRFVDGCSGEQFALPEAIDRLRVARREEPSGEYLRLAACDPLNLGGSFIPGVRVPALLGNRVIFSDCLPVAAVEGAGVRMFRPVEPSERPMLERMLDPRPLSGNGRSGSGRKSG